MLAYAPMLLPHYYEVWFMIAWLWTFTAPPKLKVSKQAKEKSLCICLVCEEIIVDASAENEGHEAVLCESKCNTWFHRRCAGLSSTGFLAVTSSSAPFYCSQCRLDIQESDRCLVHEICYQAVSSRCWVSYTKQLNTSMNGQPETLPSLEAAAVSLVQKLSRQSRHLNRHWKPLLCLTQKQLRESRHLNPLISQSRSLTWSFVARMNAHQEHLNLNGWPRIKKPLSPFSWQLIVLLMNIPSRNAFGWGNIDPIVVVPSWLRWRGHVMSP